VMGPDVTWYIVLSAFLFTIGSMGVLLRRSPLIVLLSRHLGQTDGQVFALAVMAVAASEVVVGLGLIVALHRSNVELDVDKLTSLRG
jgi:NADH-quinone oxidoreductase subunit K